MHYKNGREAKVGDSVVTRSYNGTAKAGVVISIQPGATTCNAQIVPVTVSDTVTLGECLHVDDVLPTTV